MLPDFPKLKNEISEIIEISLKSRVSELSISDSQIPKRFVFEGDKIFMRRNTGDETQTNFINLETIIEIKTDEIPNMTLQDIVCKLENAAQNMVKKKEKSFFKTLSDELEKENRSFNNKGKPFTRELFLKMLKDMSIRFDENGNPQMPTIITGPILYKKISTILQELDKEQEFKELIALKKEEWRAEQDSRKLVG